MAIEIEKKFLVHGNAWKKLAKGVFYKQGYLSKTENSVVRVRVIHDQAFLTVKGATQGIARKEFEYSISATDANDMLDHLCEKPLIEKYRYKIAHEGVVWEVDEFLGANQGLVIAEVELATVNQEVTLPSWVAEEVTGNARYYTASLVQKPFCKW